MKVLRLHKPFDMRLHDEPIPEIAEDEVLIKVASVGICASDVHYYRSGKIGDLVAEKPHVLGHEFSGTVVRVGKDVQGLAEGARVAVEPSKCCKVCPICKQGYINLCPNVTFFGTPPFDGTLREYVAWPAELCSEVSDALSFDEAAMVEPLAVGVYGVDLAEMAGGESVVILGVGAVGLSVLQAAKIVGASKLIAVDPVPERRESRAEVGRECRF